MIGGALGGAIGKLFNSVMPQVVTEPGAFVIVGMAGFFAAVSNTPISTIIFVSEMTNSYHLLLPSLLVCAVAYLLSQKWSIFENQVKSKVDSAAHAGEFMGPDFIRRVLDELQPQRIEHGVRAIEDPALVRELKVPIEAYIHVVKLDVGKFQSVALVL